MDLINYWRKCKYLFLFNSKKKQINLEYMNALLKFCCEYSTGGVSKNRNVFLHDRHIVDTPSF